MDRLAEKYAGLTPYHYGANNPIKYIDVNGDSLDISQLTKKQLEIYNENISLLKKSSLFSYYFNFISESQTLFPVSASKGKKGSSSESGQFYNSKTNEIGLGESLNAYVIAQEFFHAFQIDGKFYDTDNPMPLSSIETECDIVTIYVLIEAGLGIPSFGSWSNEFLDDALNSVPDLKKVQTPSFQNMFQKAVDNRINYYKSLNLNAPTYTAPNSGVKPKALEEMIRLK